MGSFLKDHSLDKGMEEVSLVLFLRGLFTSFEPHAHFELWLLCTFASPIVSISSIQHR